MPLQEIECVGVQLEAPLQVCLEHEGCRCIGRGKRPNRVGCEHQASRRFAQPLAGDRALATSPALGFVAIGTLAGCQRLSLLNRLRSMAEKLRPLSGSCFSADADQGWSVQAPPPQASGLAHHFEGARLRKLCALSTAHSNENRYRRILGFGRLLRLSTVCGENRYILLWPET
jgi:hypothetical protein